LAVGRVGISFIFYGLGFGNRFIPKKKMIHAKMSKIEDENKRRKNDSPIQHAGYSGILVAVQPDDHWHRIPVLPPYFAHERRHVLARPGDHKLA
jgi:hypothetical protein